MDIPWLKILALAVTFAFLAGMKLEVWLQGRQKLPSQREREEHERMWSEEERVKRELDKLKAEILAFEHDH